METKDEDIWQAFERVQKEFEEKELPIQLAEQLRYTKKMMWFAWFGWAVTALLFLAFNW